MKFQDQVYGSIEFLGIDEIIRSEPVQRLRRIKQTGFLEKVYPSAVGNRFNHSIGVAWLMDHVVDLITRRDKKYRYSNKYKHAAYFVGLLHDIGHAPLSHTFEKLDKKNAFDHEKASIALINFLLVKKYRTHRSSLKFASQVLEDAYAKKDKESPKAPTNGSDRYYHYLLKELISGAFDLDKLDYLLRDNATLGFGYSNTDYQWLKNHIRYQYKNVKSPKPYIYFPEKCCTDLQEFLARRRAFYWKCLYHDKVVGWDEMVKQAVRIALRKKLGKKNVINRVMRFLKEPPKKTLSNRTDRTEFLGLDDARVWEYFKDLLTMASEQKKKRNPNWMVLSMLLNPLVGKDSDARYEILYECNASRPPLNDEQHHKIRQSVAEQLQKYLGRKDIEKYIEYFFFSRSSEYAAYLKKEKRDIQIHREWGTLKGTASNWFGLIENAPFMTAFLQNESVTRYYVYDFGKEFLADLRRLIGIKKYQ